MIHAGVRFCLVGALVFGLDFGALWFFHQFLPRLAAVSVAYFVAVSFHYVLNKWWVFASRTADHTAELGRYVLMVVVCWLCTVAIVWLALRFFTPNVFAAKALAVPPATLLSFLLMRRFVFR